MNIKYLIIFYVIVFFNSVSWGKKINIHFGIYSLNANLGNNEKFSMTRLGIYDFSGEIGINNFLAFQLGYSIFLSKTISGDIGFGPDFRVIYYPWLGAEKVKWNDHYLYMNTIKKEKFFVTFGFHQKQFQSTESVYAGFSLGTGYEWLWKENIAWQIRGQIQNLIGASKIKLEYLDLTAGINFYLD